MKSANLRLEREVAARGTGVEESDVRYRLVTDTPRPAANEVTNLPRPIVD